MAHVAQAKARRIAGRSGGTLPVRRNKFNPYSRGDRDLTADEIEFGRAVHNYKRDHHRPAPSWSEVLWVLESLGYRPAKCVNSFAHRAVWFKCEMTRFMRDNRRPFPLFSEVLAVAKSMGYRKTTNEAIEKEAASCPQNT